MRCGNTLASLLLFAACQSDAAMQGADAGRYDAESIDCETSVPEWGAGGALMLAGSDCLDCHRDGGRAASTPFTLAGTVFFSGACSTGAEAATIYVTDANALEIQLPSNASGNFFTSEDLRFPLQVAVERNGLRKSMQTSVPSGACAGCHLPEEGQGYLHID